MKQIKKHIKKAIKEAFIAEEHHLFRSLAVLYNERLEHHSDYAKTIYHLSWFLTTPIDEMDKTDFQRCVLSFPKEKQLQKDLKKSTDVKTHIKILSNFYKTF